MGIPLRIVGWQPHSQRQPGMMWRDPAGDISNRECWCVVLPNDRRDERAAEIIWCTTDVASDPPHEMWDVSGTPPLLTVTPSIDVEFWRPDGVRDGSYWHGHITNGELV
jgi:hypothetical protein